MKTTKLMALVVLCTACATTKVNDSYSNWDNDHDNKIQRNEFVQGYISNDYFDRWGKGGTSLGYDELYSNTFKTMDKNSDMMVSRDEFDAQIKLFYFGLFNGSFQSWDTNGNGTIDENEFTGNARKSDLASLWDTSGDKSISKRELAGGMFYLCDTNGNGIVEESELTAWKSLR